MAINQFMTEQELNDLIEHFEAQIELANDYIELANMFKDIDLLQFICTNRKVIDKLMKQR